MTEDITVPRTIWTDTLLDMLGKAVREHNDNESKRILREIRHKGYQKADVLRFADKHLERAEAARLQKLISSISRRKAS